MRRVWRERVEPMEDGRWEEARPRVVLSRCLELAACRYDGAGIRSRAVRRLSLHVEWVPVCPEVEIGLGVPRAPIRVESWPGGARLVRPSTGRDLTDRMASFGALFGDRAGAVDGLLLKSRSPSCGLGDVKVYAGDSEGSEGSEPLSADGSGLFAAAMRERYAGVAMADEVGVEDPEARHHWLTRVFASARLGAALAEGVEGLRAFHTRYKLVLMAHSVDGQRRLGRLVAEARPSGPAALAELAGEYRRGFEGALGTRPTRGGQINAAQHIQGYFRDGADGAGLRAGLRELEAVQAAYVEGRVPIQSLVAALRERVERSGDAYLGDQLYFRPYPLALAHGDEGSEDADGNGEADQAE